MFFRCDFTVPSLMKMSANFFVAHPESDLLEDDHFPLGQLGRGKQCSAAWNTTKKYNMLKIAIIIGSTRPGRNGEAVAKWVHGIAQKRNDAEFELVDLKDFNLPLLDEPVPPSMGQYSKPHTKKWAAKVESFDAFVFVALV